MLSRSLSGTQQRRRRLPGLLASVLLAGTTLVACASDNQETVADPTDTAVAEGFPVTVEFEPADPVTIEDEPQRIVSLSPTTTEILFAVGAGDQVVAVDEYSNYPEDAPLIEGLSGFTPNVEAVLDHDPDLVVIMTRGEGLVEGLNAAGVPVLVVPASDDIDHTYEQIEMMGEATGNTEEATDVVEQMQVDITEALSLVPQEFKDAGLSYYHEVSSSYHSIADSTYLGQIFAEFGLASIATGGDDYPQLTSEAVVAANPDIIFLANVKAEAMDAETVASRPGWETIDAVVNDRIISLDDDLASRWGPRVPELIGQIARDLNQYVISNRDNSAEPVVAN